MEYTIEQPALSNGQDLSQVRDNRLQLMVDGKLVETWELAAIEDGKINDWLMIFARYLFRGDKPVSSNLPYRPLDDLTRAEKAQIRNSKAYKELQRFRLPTLRQAATSFMDQASSIDDDPN